MTSATEFRPSDVRSRAMFRGDLGLLPEAECMTQVITAFLGYIDAPWDTKLSFEEVSAWAMDGNPDINEQYKRMIKARDENFVTSGFFALEDAKYLTRSVHDGVTTFTVTDKFVDGMRSLTR